MASEMVGDNALLLAGMGYAYWGYYGGAFRRDEETVRKAEDYAKRAVQLDPDIAQGHFVLGLVAIVQDRMQPALRHLQKALSLSPNDPDAIFWLVFTASIVGKLAVTRPLVARLLEIDPLSPNTYNASAIQNVYEGQFEAALEPARKAIRLDPEDFLSRFAYLMACDCTKRLDELEPVLESWRREAPDNIWYEGWTAFVAARQGKGLELSDSARDVFWKDVLSAGHWFPGLYSMSGKIEEALEWMERGFELGFINYPMVAHIDPFLENLRRDPRSRDIMERIKQAWEQFEV